MIQILELFGGIGSPRIAFRNKGIPVKAIDYVEIDEKAVRSYNAMFAKELPYKTQSVIDWNLKPDILIHGSPCQDISVAGIKRGADEGSGTRSSLMWETIKIIQNMGVWRPRVVIWENVKGVLGKAMRDNFNRYLEELEKLGYTNSYSVLNAMEYGLPQNRNRVFVISKLNGEPFNFNLLKKQKMKPIQEYLEKQVSDEFTITQPSMLKKINSTSGSFGGRLKVIEDYCWTITTKQMRCPNSGIIDLGNGKYRYLTPKECWLLQGYHLDDYEAAAQVNGKTALYMQAGNSIPTVFFEAIYEVLLEQEETK